MICRTLLVVYAILFAGCAARAPVQADSDLGSFCDRLPRPEFAALSRHAASDDWFEVYEIRPGTFAIYEPWQWQEVISGASRPG